MNTRPNGFAGAQGAAAALEHFSGVLSWGSHDRFVARGGG
jgi:hypothetical protein